MPHPMRVFHRALRVEYRHPGTLALLIRRTSTDQDLIDREVRRGEGEKAAYLLEAFGSANLASLLEEYE